MTFLVERAGVFTTVQDRGRPGWSDLGVSESGAFDRLAAHQANALVGNDDSAAVLEVLGGDLVLVARHHHVVAVTGASVEVAVDDRPVAQGRAVSVPAGGRLTIGRVVAGVRTYVAVAGGIAVPDVLGSRSYDTLAGLGPDPLSVHAHLPVGPPSGRPADVDVTWSPRLGEATVDVVLGPRDDWFPTRSVDTLLGEPWIVTAHSDRVGLRLSGTALERSVTTELPSEPCVRGSIQVAADGLPIVFGPDHPVTGGYPVIAVVTDAHLDRLAQLRPGDQLRFTRTPRMP
ncbi:MAG TPA: biotin-dependent carboxyltransferase family protein [Aeromicrobium sp.]|nr:biotin-dependent carboxyltransferase family protein [Aeromicrobium sp.]